MLLKLGLISGHRDFRVRVTSHVTSPYFLLNHKYVFQKFFHLIDKFSNPTNTTVCPRSSTQGTFHSIETSPLRNVPRFQAMSVFDTIVEKISGD